MTDTYEAANRLYEIKEEIKALVHEAYELVEGTPEEGRAKAYWYAQIVMALDNEHGYMGRSMSTMMQAAQALEGDDDEA